METEAKGPEKGLNHAMSYTKFEFVEFVEDNVSDMEDVGVNLQHYADVVCDFESNEYYELNGGGLEGEVSESCTLASSCQANAAKKEGGTSYLIENRNLTREHCGFKDASSADWEAFAQSKY